MQRLLLAVNHVLFINILLISPIILAITIRGQTTLNDIIYFPVGTFDITHNEPATEVVLHVISALSLVSLPIRNLDTWSHSTPARSLGFWRKLDFECCGTSRLMVRLKDIRWQPKVELLHTFTGSWGLCNMECFFEMHLKPQSREISLPITYFSFIERFDILLNARHYHCRALCKISKRLGNWNGY